MRYSALIVALVLSLVAGVAGADEPMTIRVLSYNIHHGEGVDGKLDLNRIAKVIESVSADLVALQEVDRNSNRTGKVDQAAEIGRLTGMSAIFEKNIAVAGGDYGNAVLSKFPIKSHRNVHLPRVGDSEQRGVLVVELQPPSLKTPVFFFATHLDYRSDNRERLASAEKINELAVEHPSILAGDLNDTPDSEVLKLFRAQWKPTSDMELPTFPAESPRRQIDFILVRPADRWRVVETKAIDEAVASDHRAIFSVLELLPAELSK
jgi:endonuclease/exonuclease/phosphatase family metal-dependent hydrolase